MSSKLNIKSYIYYPVVVLLLALTATEFFPALIWAFAHLGVYQWMIYGIVAYFIVRRFSFFSRNEQWFQTLSHEATHAIVGVMFLHKIHSFKADENSGVVFHSGNKFGGLFISLAPYCLPITTYAFLLLRIIGANSMLYVFDILIGFTLAFHIVCFATQTGLYQPDIKGKGYVKSFLFIFVAWFFNATIILCSIRMGVIRAFGYTFSQYWNDLVAWWNFIF